MSDTFEDLECIKIESLEKEIEYRTSAYLRDKGWKHTSNTVGCYWMWFKSITTPVYKHGEVVGEETTPYGCDTDTAFRIQSSLDRREYADLHPEEFED